MRTDIKTDGVEVTQEMRERLDWICSKLEKMAHAKNPGALHCDFVVSKVTGSTDKAGFQASIRFFDGSGLTHEAKAAAGNPLAALDIAHDEIERTYFQEQRMKHEKQKIEDLKSRRAELAKKIAEEPPRRKPERKFGDEKDEE